LRSTVLKSIGYWARPLLLRSCYHAVGKHEMAEVKTIGSSGQISIGKEHAGRTVTVEQIENGVWLIKTAQVIPDNELWLHRPAAARELTRAVQWASRNRPSPSRLDQMAAKLKKAPKARGPHRSGS